jgi:hypothetical protein
VPSKRRVTFIERIPKARDASSFASGRIAGHRAKIMSLPKQLDIELARLGCSRVEPLIFDVPPYDGAIGWRLSFRTLGFAKGRVDGAIRYRHRIATNFGWLCLSQLGGPLWRSAEAPLWGFSGGVPFGLVGGWRADWTIDNPSSQHETTARKIAADVQANVLPFVLDMQSDEDLFRLLLQDSEPWLATIATTESIRGSRLSCENFECSGGDVLASGRQAFFSDARPVGQRRFGDLYRRRDAQG